VSSTSCTTSSTRSGATSRISSPAITLGYLLISVGIGLALVLPSLALLIVVFKGSNPSVEQFAQEESQEFYPTSEKQPQRYANKHKNPRSIQHDQISWQGSRLSQLPDLDVFASDGHSQQAPVGTEGTRITVREVRELFPRLHVPKACDLLHSPL